MYQWERRLATLAQRAVRLYWWLFDLSALLAIVSVWTDGIRYSAEWASNLLLVACMLLLWRETEKRVTA